MALNLTMTHEFCSIFIRNTVKQERSVTHMVSPDKIQHDHPLLWQPSSVFMAAESLGSVCPGLAEPRSLSELPSADQCLKFCDDTRCATTLPELKQRLIRVPAGQSACTPFTPDCRLAARSNVPEFTEPENWPPNSPDLTPVDYSVWWALQQMVYRHKISDTGQRHQ